MPNWDESNNLILRYTYEFMPKGIITRFIVIMHKWIDQQKYVWRSGVYLNKDNTKAEVIEYYDKREIKIRVAGSYKRDLLNTVTYELDKIHNSYNRLKYSKLIPCNCHQCKDSQSPYFYPFDRLRKFIADQQYNIQCQESYEMVNVPSLIDDIVDLNKLIPEDKQDSDQPINIEQLNFISRDIKELMRKINVDQGNYNEEIKRDYVNQSRNQNITNSTINSSGAAVFSSGDIYGTVANTINQLPSSSNPDEPGIKELLTQLQEAIGDPNLSADDKKEVSEQLQVLAAAGQKPQDETMQKKAKKAVGFLKVIAEGVEPATKLAQACATVLPKILLFFGLGI